MFNAYLLTNSVGYETISAIARKIDWFVLLCLIALLHQFRKLKKQNNELRQRIVELEGTQEDSSNGETA